MKISYSLYAPDSINERVYKSQFQKASVGRARLPPSRRLPKSRLGGSLTLPTDAFWNWL
jgi:hypothetical protein